MEESGLGGINNRYGSCVYPFGTRKHLRLYTSLRLARGCGSLLQGRHVVNWQGSWLANQGAPCHAHIMGIVHGAEVTIEPRAHVGEPRPIRTHEALLGGKEIPPEATVEALVYTGNLRTLCRAHVMGVVRGAEVV
ncbi:hypothetical protein R1flu_014426 [Riccia fluitans]|uniref:Uncharacterized protein n=1 Tax=Riccia fluitans TaxID=41844 RepID=A0ABD1YGT4_9MARC